MVEYAPPKEAYSGNSALIEEAQKSVFAELTKADKVQTVFISSSRDMAEWAALAADHLKDFSVRHGVPDLHARDYRDVDPAHFDHSITWQDTIGAPSRLDTALTLVFFGERIGTPLPTDFALASEIFGRLSKGGFDWVHVAGCSPTPLQPNQVPLTGVLFEFFDAFLPRGDGSPPCPLRVIFKGKWDGSDEPEFGNGEFREQIEQASPTMQQKRLARAEYNRQLEWLYIFWSKLFGSQQHASLFCADQPQLIEQLNKIFSSSFLGTGDDEAGPFPRLDPHNVNLPGPAPYDLARAPLYFGRAAQVAELARRALQHKAPRRIVPVTGDSGAGKSSLLRSGLTQHALASARRRLGWRLAFLSLTDRRGNQSPILFLAESLLAAIPELGALSILCERLEGLDPLSAAKRLLQILTDLHLSQAPGFGQPKLLLILDQLEIALDAVSLGSADAPEWNIFLQTIAALGGACLDPAACDTLDPLASDLAAKLPLSVVFAIPADRMSSLSALLQPGDHVLWLPRLTDETAVYEIIRNTFATLGLTIQPRALDVLCRQAVRLALNTQASVLPVLAATLASLHDEWKWRSVFLEHSRAAEEKWKTMAPPDAPMPLGLKMMVVDHTARQFDIETQDLDEHKQLERAIGRLGDAAWWEVDAHESNLRAQIQELPITNPRQRVISGEITARDFSLAWLLRHLVSISSDDGAPDRLVPLPDSRMPPFARPLAEALRRNRLLTRHEDGTWWLVHQAVISGWDRAAAWREAEKQTFRTMERLAQDYTRWKEEIAAGDSDGAHRLWTRARDIEAAKEWLMLWGADDRPELAAFVRKSFIAAAAEGQSLAGECLHVSVWFQDLDWCKAILDAAGAGRVQACNRMNKAGSASVLTTSCYSGNVEITKFLLENGADPNLQIAGNRTPLLVAASIGSEEVCEALLAAGAVPDCVNSEGWTTLMYAAQNGLTAIVERMLAAGVSVDHANTQGATALLLAAANGHTMTVHRLLEFGAALGSVDVDGYTPLIWASRNGHEAVVKSLLLAGAPIDQPIHDLKQHKSIAQTLGEPKLSINEEAHEGWTALMIAARNGHEPVVSCLLAAGASVCATGEDLTTALMLAADKGHDAVVAKLLGAGAAVDGTNRWGLSALLIAVHSQRHAIAARLLASGATVDLAYNDGQTPLMLTVKVENRELSELCLRYGADPMRRNNSGLSALDLAYIYKAQPIIDALLSAGAQPPSQDELESLLKQKPGMNIGLVVNARGKMCLVHDERFEGIPYCVGYHLDERKIEIFFDNGESYPIDWQATDEMDDYLKKISKILIIRMQNKTPIEGYDTSLLHLKEGQVIELE